jgi:hypothetical protein
MIGCRARTAITAAHRPKVKPLARELGKPQQEGSIPIDQLNASNDD